MKVLHIVGGSSKGGAFKGAKILHDSLNKLNVNSIILNDNVENKYRYNEK